MSGISISLVQGSGALAHNNREYINKNVDAERIKDNIDYKNETLEKAYENCFGASVERYNSKQKRNDRKVDNYLDQIKKSKNKEKVFYETIVQVGDKYSNAVGTRDGEKAKEILDEYAKSFQERNPNLYVFNMKMHLDEATPHLHIDYIPVATGYTRGLDTRNSLTKAHQNMGIEKGSSKNDNSTIRWQNKERDTLRSICERNKIKVIDKNVNREHLTVDEYKVQAETIEKLYHQNINKDIIDIDISNVPFSNKKMIDSNDLDKLIDNSKVNEFSKEQFEVILEEIRVKEKALQMEKLNINRYSKNLDKFHGILNQKETDLNKMETITKEKYQNQINLNEKYDNLKDKTEIQSAELEKYKSKSQNLAHVNTNLMKAINLLAHDDKDYKASLTKKQSRLLEALENYTKSWLKSTGYDDLAKNVEDNIGLSKGIQNQLKELTKIQNRGYER